MNTVLARSLALVGLSILLAVAAVAAQDELRLRDGTVLKGHLLELNRETVTVRTAEGVRQFKRDDVAAISLDRKAQPRAVLAAPDETPVSQGFTCADGLRIVRVVTFRQITSNKALDKGKLEPTVAKFSADGSKIAFHAPQSGLYTIEPDGTEINQLWKNDGTLKTSLVGERFQVSPDGRCVFWQQGHEGWNPALPVHRIQSDGTKEKLLVRTGADPGQLRFRQGGQRIFFAQHGGLYSIDVEGKGDLKEIVTTKQLGQVFDVPDVQLSAFDVSEDGQRIVLVVWHPREKKQQLFRLCGDGTEFKEILKTDFEPIWPTITPNGKQIVFWQAIGIYRAKAHVVNWDGGSLRELPLPFSGTTVSPHLNRFSSDGTWFACDVGSGGGLQIMRLDGTGRWAPLDVGRAWEHPDSIFRGLHNWDCTPDLRRFCFINRHRVFGAGPAQLVVADVNPPKAEGLPVLSEIEFPPVVSTNPKVPNHLGTLKVKVQGGSDNLRVQYLLTPNCQRVNDNPVDWDPERGWYGLGGHNTLADDGKNGDEKAKDGVWTTDAFGPDVRDTRYRRPPAGRYVLRIIAHDERQAVAVDVDGVEIRN